MANETMKPAEVVKTMEQNAEHGVSNLCEWNKMSPQDQKSIFAAYRDDKSHLPDLQFTFDQDGPHLKEKPGLVCEAGQKQPEAQAKETVDGLRKNAGKPAETIAAVNKIQPEEQRQLVLKEMSENRFPGVVIEKHRNGNGIEYSITEDRSQTTAKALEYKASGHEVWDKPLASTEAEKQAAAKEKAHGIVDTAQETFAKPWLPLPENKRLEASADLAEGALHKKIADLRGDPNRDKVLAELEKQGAKITRDEQGRPVEITFTRQLDGSDPIGSVADKFVGNKVTIPLDKSYEEMKAEAKERFYAGAHALQGFGMIAGKAAEREAAKDTSTKYWFER